MPIKCYNNQCTKDIEEGYELCRDCIHEFVRICTCKKTFTTEPPTHYVLGKKDSLITVLKLPETIPDFFYINITGILYHILGCRGCQYTEAISVNNNFTDALRASIQSCVYQRVEEDGRIFYEYLGDSLDPVFEDYIQQKGIKVGEVAKIVIGGSNEDTGPVGPVIEIPSDT